MRRHAFRSSLNWDRIVVRRSAAERKNPPRSGGLLSDLLPARIILITLGVLFGSTAGAQTTYTWNNSGTLWSSPSSWTPSGGPPGSAAGDMAVFAPSISASVIDQPTVDSSFSLEQVMIASAFPFGNYTFSGSGSLALGAAGPGGNVLTPNGTSGGLIVRGAGITTFNGPSLAGAGSSALNQAQISIGHGSELILTGTSTANSNMGSVDVQGGTLTIDNSTNNILNRLSLGGNNLFLQDSGKFILNASPSGGTVNPSTSTTGLNFTSGDNVVQINLSATPTAQTILLFGGYTRQLMTGATVDFVLTQPSGGSNTLGGSGATDPLVQFTQTINLPTSNTQILKANSGGGSGGNATGVAFVNGTDFAAWNPSTLSIVAVVTTSANSSNLSSATGNIAFTPNAGGTTTLSASTAIALISMKLNVPAGETTLNLNSNTLNLTGLIVPGANNYSITGTSSAGLFGGAESGSKVVFVTLPTTVLSVGVSMGFGATSAQGFPLIKSGPGIVALTASFDQVDLGKNPQSMANSLYLNGGVLRANYGVNLLSTDNVIAFRGGALEIANGATFKQSLGIALGNVNWDSGKGTGDGGSGGFSAVNQPATINIGGSAAALTWGQQYFVQDGSALTFGSVASNSTVIWQNPTALDSGTAGAYAVREIQVTAGLGGPSDKTQFTATISGSNSTDLLKSGTGVLELTAANGNTYSGNTLISAGTLLVSNTNPATSATGTGNVSVGTGSALGGAGFLAPSAGNTVSIQTGGTLAPGNPAGILTVNAPVTLASGSIFSWTLNNSAPSSASLNSGQSNAPGLQSQLTIGGTGNTLTAGNLAFHIVEQSPPNFTPGLTYSWLVANTQGSPILGNVTFDLSAASTFAAYGGSSELSLQVSGNDIYLDFIPVPEPGMLLVISGVGLVAGRFCRRVWGKR